MASPLEGMAREWLAARPYRNATLDTGTLTDLLARVQREERERAKRIVREQQISDLLGHWFRYDKILRRLDEEE